MSRIVGLAALLALVCWPTPAGAQSQPTTSGAASRDGYLAYREFADALRALTTSADSPATLSSLAKSSGGRDLWLLTIANGGAQPPEQRLALLIVGGIDAERPAGSATALRVARWLINTAREKPDGPEAALLATRTVYVIPRANPDGIETFLEAVRHEARVNARPIDEDRDGAVNEDGPNDMNGDGLITVMRVPDVEGRWMVDADEPRLMKKADAAKAETGVYKLMLEGVDDDSDGEINEDGPGGVDDDRNWPHLYQSGAQGAGAHQLSEPETRALAQFVADHPRIAGAIVYGRHDNIVKIPKGKDRGPDGQSYRDLHPDDVAFYEHISEIFKQTTSLTESSGCEPAGALYAWLYSQRAIVTIATNLWHLPESEKPAAESQPAEGDAAKHDDADSGDEQTDDDAAVRERGRRGRRGGGPPGGPGGRPPGAPDAVDGDAEQADEPLAERVASNDDAKKWLKYSDELRGGSGFVNWTRVKHPTLGDVEIGGFAPYFRTTPPAVDLDVIAEKQSAFVLALSDMLPRPRFGETKCEHVGADVWKIDLRLVNDGYLPTHTAIAKQTEQPPWAIRPLVEPERIVGGRRLERVPNIGGSGGAVELRWLIRGAAGATVQFRAVNRMYGELVLDVTLKETKPQEAAE